MKNKNRKQIPRDPESELKETLIEKLRKQNMWTQKYLARITGYSKLNILKLEQRRIGYSNSCVRLLRNLDYKRNWRSRKRTR